MTVDIHLQYQRRNKKQGNKMVDQKLDTLVTLMHEMMAQFKTHNQGTPTKIEGSTR